VPNTLTLMIFSFVSNQVSMKLTLLLLLICISTVCFGQFNKKTRSRQAQSVNNNLPDSLKYSIIETSAEPANGMGGFYNYIRKKIKYPRDAKREGIHGKVLISFIVGVDGVIEQESIKVIESLFPSCDKEAIRLIQNAKAWNPGMSQGKPVRQKIALPIHFR